MEDVRHRLISLDNGVGALQTVVDPVSGNSPGNVVGIFPQNQLGAGVLVGKTGVTTGWTEGTVFGVVSWYNMTAYCANNGDNTFGWAGDSGGPVWRSDGRGHVWAVGIIVSYYTSGEHVGAACFVPIQRLLSEWGNASLPVFSMAQALTVPPGSTAPLPRLSTTYLVPAVGRK